MKILLISDVHFGVRNGSLKFLNMMDKYYKEELFPLIEEKGIKTIICLGDLLDKRKSIDYMISSYLKNKFFTYFEENKIDFYNITGNHDLYYRDSMEIDGPSQLFNEFKHFHSLKEPTLMRFDGTEFVCVPWMCSENKKEIMDFIERNSSPSRFLLGHLELFGFTIANGVTSQTGNMELESLENYKKVISGHYHTPSEKGNIIYLGSPYQFTWNDYGDKKRVMIYDTETEEFETYETKTLIFHKIVYSEDIPIDTEKYKDCFVKVVLDEKTDNKKLEKFMEKLNKSSPENVQIIDSSEESIPEITNVTKDDILNPEKIMFSMIDEEFKDLEYNKLAKDLLNQIIKGTEND